MLSVLGGWVRWLAGIDDPKDNQAAPVDSDSGMDADDSSHGHTQDDSASTNNPRGDYLPTDADVQVVKSLLSVPHGYSLPPEIVDIIVDHAGYWAHTTSEVRFGNDMQTMRSISQHVENAFLLRTPPLGFHHWPSQTTANPPVLFPTSAPLAAPFDILTHQPNRNPEGVPYPPEAFQHLLNSPILAHPCRKIVFTIRSRDQGWGGTHADRHTYNSSWTWFEAGLERWSPDHVPLDNDIPPHEAGLERWSPDRGARYRRWSRGSRRWSPSLERWSPDHVPLDNDMPPHDAVTSPGSSPSTSPSPSTPDQPSLHFQDLCTVQPPVGNGIDTPSNDFQFQLHADERFLIQRNRTATDEVREHRVVWSWTDDVDPADEAGAAALAAEGRGKATGDGKFVRDLQVGDVVTVWGKSRFPGWVNYVESVKVEVFWAV